MLPRFFVWSLNSRLLRGQIEQAISGADGLANNLPQSALLRFAIAFPSIDEQEAITSALKRARPGDLVVVFADNILGIPGGTLEDDLRTLELNIELDVDYAAATLCTPYPGTGIAKYAVENGHFDGDWDRIDESYYTESVLTFSSPAEKRQIENLHKLFAVAAALPAALPLVKRLLPLPPNDFFYAMFRSWYLISHMTDVMPRELEAGDLLESVAGVFGVYRGAEENRWSVPAPEALPIVDAAPRGEPPVVSLRRRAPREEGAHVR